MCYCERRVKATAALYARSCTHVHHGEAVNSAVYGMLKTGVDQWPWCRDEQVGTTFAGSARCLLRGEQEYRFTISGADWDGRVIRVTALPGHVLARGHCASRTPGPHFDRAHDADEQ